MAVTRTILAPGEELADTALFCGTSKGPVLTCLAALEKLSHGGSVTDSQAWHVTLGVGAMGAALAREWSVRQVHTSVAACASGMFALHHAAGALSRGECERALVVAADASLHPLFEGSFARLGVLAPADGNGARTCRPFDPEGHGFFLSEGAAALLLERQPRAGHALAWLDASWIGGDGTGILAVDPETKALRQGLAHCLSTVAPLPAFIHAHATGTEHDRFELEAIEAAARGLPRECVISHKGQLGHTLGAAGLVGVVLSVLSHVHRRTFTGLPVPAGSSSVTVAQGFGGHVAVVRLRG